MTRPSSRENWIELGVSLTLAALFLYASIQMPNWVIETMPATVDPAFFPALTSKLMFLFSVVLVGIVLWTMFRKDPGKAGIMRKATEKGAEGTSRVLSLFAYIAIMFLYLIGMHYVGFLISTPLVMLAVALLLGIRHWIIGFACYVAFTFILDYSTFHFMQIILPAGVLFE